MNAIDIALPLTKTWESCRLTAYPDPVSGADPWTVGWGATGPSIGPDTVWTQVQADADLESRLNQIYVEIAPHCPAGATAVQIGACMDFAYNEGIHAFLTSTLLAEWRAGNVAGAAAQFLRWDIAGGHVVQGLENRRADERRIFLGG